MKAVPVVRLDVVDILAADAGHRKAVVRRALEAFVHTADHPVPDLRVTSVVTAASEPGDEHRRVRKVASALSTGHDERHTAVVDQAVVVNMERPANVP